MADEPIVDELSKEPHGISFLGALAEVATGRAEFVDRAEYLRRLEICNACPDKIRRLNVCGLCKCVLPLKAKLAHAHCPKGLW